MGMIVITAFACNIEQAFPGMAIPDPGDGRLTAGEADELFGADA